MEIELKLALDPRDLPRLKRHPALSGAKPQFRTLHSVYYDTPDFALMGRGIAYRLRRVGYHWVQTVKAESASVGALSSRPEWEVQVADNQPDFSVLPPEALACFDGVDHTLLAPVFITEFKRQTWQIEIGETRAEVAVDVGQILAGECKAGLCEVEIELKSGLPVDLFDLALRLHGDVPLLVEPRSKAARGYALAGAYLPAPVKAIQPPLTPRMPAGEAWRAIVRAALTQATANVPGFLAEPENIEYLHQLRVALRRLRVAASLAKGLGLDRPGWENGLRDVMHKLNPARDWDVFLEGTLPRATEVFENDAIGEPLLHQIQQTAAKARQLAQDAVVAPEFTRLIMEIGRGLLDPVDVDSTAKAWSAHVLEERWKDLHKRGRKITKLGPGGRHEVRIAAKRMRYAAEAFDVLYGKRARKYLVCLAALQDGLGLANDVAMASQLLRGIGGRHPQLAFDCGRIVGMLVVMARNHGDLAGRQWRDLLEAPLFWR